MVPRSLHRTAFASMQRRSTRSIAIQSHPRALTSPCSSQQRASHSRQRGPPHRTYATSKSLADTKIDEIQEQYATTKDEFEIAVEETSKKTVYAADDRAAAQEELGKLKALYDGAVSGADGSGPEVGKEIQRRVGQRIRELDHAIQGLEESARGSD